LLAPERVSDGCLELPRQRDDFVMRIAATVAAEDRHALRVIDHCCEPAQIGFGRAQDGRVGANHRIESAG